MPRNPRLWQCIPAEQQYDCYTSAEMMHINQEILTLRGTTNIKSQEQRKKLYAEKRKLIAERLRKWQNNQPVKHDDLPGYPRAIFDCVRFLMPEWDRLAQNLFLIDKLRSPAGLAVLHDMLSLYQKRRNVEYRPGPEPDRCYCRKNSDGSSYDWRHIYDCLVYGAVLARAGYCPFCLGDERMPASVRMYHFQKRWTWLDHIQIHIRELKNATRPLNCPCLHSHCPRRFDSVLDLQAKYTFGNTCSDVKKGSHIPNRQGFAKSLRFSAARVLLTAKTRRHPVIALAIFRSVRGSN